MNTHPLISIALCTFNGEDYLREQMDSLVTQTYPNIEIIIVDDFSEDSTLMILESYAHQYSNISIFQNPQRLGLSRNFEKALSLCKGEFIAISDQDDIWKPDKISIMYGSIKDHILINSKSEVIDSEGHPLYKDSIGKYGIPYSGSDPRVITIFDFTFGHNLLFHRKLLSYALPLPEGIEYDRMLGLVALNYGRVQFLDQTLVFHRQHGKNASSSKSLKEEKLRQLKVRLEAILTLKDLRYEDFFKKFLQLINLASHSKSGKIKLFLFFLKNRKVLFYTSRKNIFSKMNKIRKMLR